MFGFDFHGKCFMSTKIDLRWELRTCYNGDDGAFTKTELLISITVKKIKVKKGIS